MKFLRSAFFIVLVFSFAVVSAEAVVTGSSPDWSLYYSFDNILYRLNYSNAVVDHKDTNDATPRGKYKDLDGSTIYPYSITTTVSGGAPFNGRAAALDGTRYIEMGGTYPLESLGESGGHQITISLWVKFLNTTPEGDDCFIGKNDSSGGNDFLFGIWGGRMYVRIDTHYRNQTYVDGTNGSTIDVYDEEWHNFIVSIKEDTVNQGTSDVTLWIDGEKEWDQLSVSDLVYDSDMQNAPSPFIGMELDGTTETDLLEGYVDELQIFTAVANDTDAANLYNGRFGVPSDFDVWTSSIENYDVGDDLGGSHDNSDGFLYNAHLTMDADPSNTDYHYYEYLNAASDFSSVAHDVDVLVGDPPGSEWMTDPAQNDYEVVFHAGHGRPRGPRDWNNSDLHLLTPDDFTYTGSTRWVFWQSCSTMKPVAHGRKPCSLNDEPCCSNDSVGDICYGGSIQPSPSTYFYENEGLNWFGDRFDSDSGPHAFFGFASTMVFYSYPNTEEDDCWWSANNYSPSYAVTGSDYCPSDGTDSIRALFNQTFWEDVVKNNVPIWEAYKDAVEQRAFNVSVDPISIEATVAFKYDTDTGFDGSMEQWNSTFRAGSNASMEIGMDTEVFQRCIYQSEWGCLQYEDPTYRED